MSKYPQEVVDDLLAHLDGLDVLELIDYHPESIRREGDIVYACCPICQVTSERYLELNLRTKEFTSNPPDLPAQTGNLIDLYARARHIGLDDATEQLAEEFGILLLDPGMTRDPEVLLAEAQKFLETARDNEQERPRALTEAEKRFARVAQMDPLDLRALRGTMEVRTLQGNPLTMAQATLRVTEACKQKGDFEGLIEAARLHLSRVPGEMPVRRHMAEALARLERHEEAVVEFLRLAEDLERAMMVEEALAAYRRAAALADNVEEITTRLLECLNRAGRENEAAEELHKRIEHLKAAKDYHRASRVAEQRLALAPDDDDARLQAIELAILGGLDDDALARCLALVEQMAARGNEERVVEALSFLLAERPDDTRLLERMIVSYRRQGEEELASELEFRLAALYCEHGLSSQARKLLDARLEQEPDNPRIRLELALLHARDRREEQAAADIAEVVDLYLQNMDDPGALEAVQRFVEILPRQWDEREREIELLWALGRRQDAEQKLAALAAELEAARLWERLVTALEAHLHRHPEHIDTIVRLAKAHEQTGDTARSGEVRRSTVVRMLEQEALDEAEALLESFVETSPDDPELLENLAELYRRRDRGQERRTVLLRLADAHAGADRKREACDVLDAMTGEFPGDAEVFERAWKAFDNAGDEEGLRRIAPPMLDAYSTAGDLKKLRAMAEAARKRLPGEPPVLQALLHVYTELGEKKKLVETARSLAKTSREQGNSELEIDALRKLLSSEAGDLDALERLVLLLAEGGGDEELTARAGEFLDKRGGDIDRAVSLLQKVAEKAPRQKELRLQLIALLKTAGRDDELATELESAAEIFEADDGTEKLVELYGELLRLKPDNLIARSRLADALHKLQRHDDSVREYLELARLYREARRLSEAAATCEKLYAMDPRNPAVLKIHAELLREMGHDDAAARKIRQLATVLSEDGKTDRAIDELRQWTDAAAGDRELRLTVIELLRNAQRFDEAAAELRDLSDLQLQEGDAKAAVASLREAVAMMPEAFDIRERLISRLAESSRLDEARTESLALAEMLAQRGQPSKALTVTEKLLKETPSFIGARRLRAQIYDEMGDEKKALSEYRELQGYLEVVPRTSSTALAEMDPEETGGFFPGLQIMEEYDFDSFVVGSKNNFAFATARAVADRPGKAHNPLFLYSDVGLGKTHLLQAIAIELRRRNPDIRILYASTEYFTSALVEAIQNNTVTAFRNRHRKSDVLLLDDVQFLAGKERSQEEFFHIFNILHQDGRQIVVTSDRPPKDIAHLDMRIRSRFGQGVIVDIQSPDLETRIAILRAEAARRAIEAPADALAVLAERVTSNVRELKGAFNQLITQHELCGDPLDADTARTIVAKFYAA